MTEPGTAEVDGTLDLTDKYGHLSNRDGGETVAGTTEDDEGEEETVSWPSEVDPEDLTQRQREAFRHALRNPMLTASTIDDRVGYAAGGTAKVFRQNAPEWYESVFKRQGGSTRSTTSQSSETTDTREAPATPKTDLEQVLTVCRYLAQRDDREGELAGWIVEVLDS